MCREWRGSRREPGESVGFPAGLGAQAPFPGGALVAALPCVGPVGRAGLISHRLRDGLGIEQEAGLIG